MAERAITTIMAKKKMLLARAGQQPLPRIAQMAFGSGGVDDDGEVRVPGNEQGCLVQEIYRKNIDKYEVASDTRISYHCTLGESELEGAEISEIALIDADGDAIAIKNFMPKGKDGDWEMLFIINDTM